MEARTVTRAEVARRIEKKLGAAIASDFDAAGPGTVRFASGVGKIEVAEIGDGSYVRNKATILHTQTCTATGARVDVCLFGSMEHLLGFQPTDAVVEGWSSSA